MGYSFHSLRERLLLLVVIASLPVVTLIVYSAMTERQGAAIEAERNVDNLVSIAVHEQGQLIEETRQLLVLLSRLPALRPGMDPGECHRLMSTLLAAQSRYTNIGVAATDGRVYCSGVPITGIVDISDRMYFRRAMTSDDFAIGDYQIGRLTDDSAINFGFPVSDDAGNTVAIVYAALGLTWLNEVFDNLDLPPGSTVTLVDSGGTVLARQPEPGRWVGESILETQLARTILTGEGMTSRTLPGLDDIVRFYGLAPLADDLPGGAWFAVGIPEAEVYGDADRALIRNLSLLATMILLTLVAAWFGSNLFVLRPLRVITDTARKLADGRMDARTGLQYGVDELGQLARDFDSMAAALQRGNRALKTLSEGNRAMVRATGEAELLRKMCRIIVDIGGYRRAWVGYFDKHGDLVSQAAAGSESETGMDPFEPARSAVADAVERRSPVVFCFDETGQRACVLFPLVVEQRPVGILMICSDDTDVFDEEEVELLHESADDLAYGIAALRTRANHREATETINQMVYYDGLTGLPNHVYLDHFIRQRLSDDAIDDKSFTLLVLDLDRFREINSALGFGHGDQLLKEVAGRLRPVIGDQDMVARMRGDEFAVLQVDGDPVRLAQTIIDALDQPFVSGHLTLAISASLGIAHYPEHGADIDHLARHAEVAMRDAKAGGRRFAIYEAARDRDGARRVTLAGELKQAIDSDDQLLLYYQPKVKIADGRLDGVEALVRWQHPQRGLIPPGEFIMLAEQTGLIKPLTDRVLEMALWQVKGWQARGIPMRVAVNLSARNLQDPELPARLEALLERSGVQAQSLELELTESAVMDDPRNGMQVLNRLSEAGIRLYIDDFGTGYSSLAYLQRLPVHAMKIDKSFVSDMLVDADLAKIVRSTIDLAHDLDLAVVAEGVESAAILERLARLGCDIAQGYHISRPQPADGLETWLHDRGDGPEPMASVRD